MSLCAARNYKDSSELLKKYQEDRDEEPLRQAAKAIGDGNRTSRYFELHARDRLIDFLKSVDGFDRHRTRIMLESGGLSAYVDDQKSFKLMEQVLGDHITLMVFGPGATRVMALLSDRLQEGMIAEPVKKPRNPSPKSLRLNRWFEASFARPRHKIDSSDQQAIRKAGKEEEQFVSRQIRISIDGTPVFLGKTSSRRTQIIDWHDPVGHLAHMLNQAGDHSTVVVEVEDAQGDLFERWKRLLTRDIPLLRVKDEDGA